MARVSIFLIIIALMVGMVGCIFVRYDLTVSSTEGGRVTDPGEATFTYGKGTVVNLVAESEEGYRFVNWIGDVGAIANVNAMTTIITMNGDYSIVANFAPQIWEIRDWHDLDAIRNNLGRKYVLTNDLDSTTAGYIELASETANQGKGWEPIGTADDQFTGSFDGRGYEIEDLFIDRPDENHVGLFGDVGEDGVAQDAGVVDVTVNGNDYVGGLVGHTDGTVSNSYSTGSVTGSSHVGGLVGYNTATVSNSFWDKATSGMEVSDGGTRKTSAEMMDITTFSDAGWNIIAVANPGTRNPSYIWNIVDDETYPFLSWQSVS